MADTPAASPSLAPAPPADPVIARQQSLANLDKTRADARKSAADATTAETAAQLGVRKAAIGEVPASGFTGAATSGEGAGLAEQNALAGLGLRDLAPRVAAGALGGDPAAVALTPRPDRTSLFWRKQDTASAPPPDQAELQRLGAASSVAAFYIATADTLPNLAAAKSFYVQQRLITDALTQALALSDAVGTGTGGGVHKTGFLAPMTAAGLVLSGISSILTYAKTDTALGGRDLAPSEQSLLTLVAEALLVAGKTVRIGGTTPPVAEITLATLVEELELLSESASKARVAAAEHAAKIKQLTPVATPAPTPPKQPATDDKDKKGVVDAGASGSGGTGGTPPPLDPDGRKPKHERALLALDDAIGMFDEFMKAMLADQAGAPALVRVAEARELETFLAPARILVVSLEPGYGTYMSRNSVWRNIFGFDYRVRAYVAASWRSHDPASYTLKGAGTATWFCDYMPLEDVRLRS